MNASSDDMTSSSAWLYALVDACRERRHRGVIWIPASPETARARALSLWRARTWHAPLWVGQTAPGDTIDALAPRQARTRLGREHDLIIIDAGAEPGFDPDAFGALSGTLRAGGVLVILTPAEWAAGQVGPDADYARLAHWPHAPTTLSAHYLARLARGLRREPSVWRWPDEHASPHPGRLPEVSAPAASSPGDACITHDQQEAVHRLTRLRRRRPVVLSADRGRGKSAALGIAAGRRLAAGETTLWVTAPRQAAVEPLFERLAALYPHGHRDAARFQITLEAGECEVRFLAPDAVMAALSEPDVDRHAPPTLFVDEAAAIPTPLLARWLEAFPRLAFATTVHGYEGTGRGFQVRFYARLSRRTPDWREIRLREPVRWADGDPLERLTRDILLLDAAPADDSEAEAALAAAPLRIRWLDRATLADDEHALEALFGLLVQAHYRTTPSDLRQLLDGPDVRLAVAYAGDTCLGVCQVQAEGGFPADLAECVVLGERRPRGHLLAQSLAAHGGWQTALTSRWWRIMRIAVHPVARRRGVGRALVEAVATAACSHEVAYLGVSFGAEAMLIAFWRRLGFISLRLGLTREAASGEHALMMGRALMPPARASLATWADDFQYLLPSLLAFELAHLETDVVTALLHEGAVPAVNADLYARLERFAQGGGELALARPWLCRAWLAWWRRQPQKAADETLDEDVQALRDWAATLFQGRDVEATRAMGRQVRIAHWRRLAGLLRCRLEPTP
ncbi:tRNA(Met) cytidine acetyltransferase TmcA [Chromohalobacter nigrandesensis]|uniref:tRNA(Met) cytidine acetyltransferase TmcA n=1 Tax=Chromohalobacter nigrandesensis TaxID=119863 RepID=UPI001FF2C99D|nr:GNAT family N-acetyltransferase [Chromohalobacter nigrandesensis]MCK0745510.1 GNAT family N-acetyltransferase [Chromohalobacter nigrandesensis]